jgi:hypothetical protein
MEFFENLASSLQNDRLRQGASVHRRYLLWPEVVYCGDGFFDEEVASLASDDVVFDSRAVCAACDCACGGQVMSLVVGELDEQCLGSSAGRSAGR